VGVGVIVQHNNKFLLAKRKNAHGAGTWCCPGGHLELNEEIETCAKREVLEEAGIEIQNVRFAAVTNDIFPEESKHYITLFVLADYASGEVEVKEPHKKRKVGMVRLV